MAGIPPPVEGKRDTRALCASRGHCCWTSAGSGQRDGNDKLVLRYRPAFLIDAIWRQFAREAAGIIRCARCPAPNCGRWFLRSAGRSDR